MSSWIAIYAKKNKLKQVDSKTPLRIEVTHPDIRKATLKEPNCCAFARACKRTMPNVKDAFFFRTTAYLAIDDKLVRYTLPKSIQSEIFAFDRSRSMEPGTYEAKAVPKSQKLSTMRKYDRTQRSKASRSGSKTNPTRKHPVRRHPTGVRVFSAPAE